LQRKGLDRQANLSIEPRRFLKMTSATTIADGDIAIARGNPELPELL
jgi:hypothetical protein